MHNPKLSVTQAFATPSALQAAGRPRSELRALLRSLRDTLPQRALRERGIDAMLTQELHELRAHCIGVYCASRGEYDALAVVQRMAAAQDRSWSIALPVVRPGAGRMEFCCWRPGQALRRGAFGIDEPVDCTQVVEPDVLVLPCLGFGDDGLRLGYGGGYYDRYLEHRRVHTIGVAFDACRVEGLAAQAHDRLLDVVLTESRRYTWPLRSATR